MEIRRDVGVVGGGIAGLAAARALRAVGVSVAVLEARGRVGGRTLNVDIGETWGEIGGEWVATHHTAVRGLVDELGLELFSSFREGKHVYVSPGGERVLYETDDPPLPAATATAFDKGVAALDALATVADPEAPWRHPDATFLDAVTLEAWLRETVADEESRDNLRTMLVSFLAVPAAEVSLLHMVMFVASAGGFHHLYDPSVCLADRVLGGSQLLSIRMAEELGDDVLLSSPVRLCAWGTDGVVLRSDDLTVRANRAVIAVPPALVDRVAFDPLLPGWRAQLNQHMPMGSVFKILAAYPEPFWRAQGLSGQGSSPHGVVAELYDNSPPDGSVGVLTTFVVSEHARRLSALSPQARREATLDELARYHGPAARLPIDYREHLWINEEWSRGGYNGNFGPGGWLAFGPRLYEPIGPLHWTGAETSGVAFGHMEGALRSGRRAAAEVLTMLT